MVVTGQHLISKKKTIFVAHHSIALLLPGYIQKFSLIIAVFTAVGQTARATAGVTAAAVAVVGGFFRVLFSWKETEALFIHCPNIYETLV